MAKVKMSKKKKIMLIICVCTLFVGIIVIMLMRNYKRARAAEDALNSEGVQEKISFFDEWNSANDAKKKEILNATMTESQAETFAQAFWAEAKGVTDKKEKKRISEMVCSIPTGADLSRISSAYSKLGLGRGGRSFVEQVKYELNGKKWAKALNHLTELSKDMINS